MSKKYAGLENKKILVVEDVELNQYLARHIMESWGCKVEIAETGAEALKKLNEKDYDLVLMDIQMPVMDGMEATRHIRKMPDTKKSAIPIIALTANARREEFESYIHAGMNDCVPKPFEEPALFATITKYIQKDKDSSMYVSFADRMAQAEEAPVKLYDLAMVEAISGGDQSFIEKMLRLFLDTVPATLSDLTAATENGDWMKMSKLAHKLKSTIDSMGIVSLKHDIRMIENDGKNGVNLEGLPGLVKKVNDTLQLVMRQVKKDHAL